MKNMNPFDILFVITIGCAFLLAYQLPRAWENSKQQFTDPEPEQLGICGHTNINRIYSRDLMDIAVVCVNRDGWVFRIPQGLNDNDYRHYIIPMIDSLRVEAQKKGIYQLQFDEQLITW